MQQKPLLNLRNVVKHFDISGGFLDQLRLTGSGIVRKQEANTGQFQQIVIHSFKLMGERIYTGYRKREVRVKLVGNTKGVCLQAKPENLTITCVCEVRA